MPYTDEEKRKNKTKRLGEFKKWLDTFKEYYETTFNAAINYVDDAPTYLNDWYWIRRETDIIPYMEGDTPDDEILINKYKIISGIELAIVGFQPIINDDIDERSKLNAELAWFTSLAFLINWTEVDQTVIAKIIQNEENVFRFVIEHRKWLTKLDAQYAYPVFSNSHTWWNFHLVLDLYTEKYKSIQS
jgi:hypothetical protein